jgi:hypothetical protein
MYGTRSGQYTAQVDVVGRTDFTLTLPDGTYYFVVRAFSFDGLTSAPSNEVIAFVGTGVVPSPTPTTSCTTPDPFASMGGGTCYNGGWLPPGIPVPGQTVAPAPSPTPSPTPAPAPAPSGSCSTPDPFASMGGGTCYNGGWLPPGMPVPGQTVTPTPTPAPKPTPTPTPPPPPAPSPVPSGVCMTSDPFASLGGGTCYNGGWLPPGMPVPGGSAVPTQPPSTGDCTTPDPFTAIGGGTCYNGGWLPPGMTPANLEVVVDVTATGTVRRDEATGEWFIEVDDGQLYRSPTEFADGLIVDGATVSFQGTVISAPTAESAFTVVEIQTLVLVR